MNDSKQNKQSKIVPQRSFTRRAFVKSAAALGAVGTIAGSAGVSLTNSLSGILQASAEVSSLPDLRKTYRSGFGQCGIDCGTSCCFRWHTDDRGHIYFSHEFLNSGTVRPFACTRSHFLKDVIHGDKRIVQPLKRIGRRGEGKFISITWDEAIQTIADKIRHTIDSFGNEAIYLNYGTGVSGIMSNPAKRLFALLGGYLNFRENHNMQMAQSGLSFMFGSDASKGKIFKVHDKRFASTFSEAEKNSDLMVLFGCNSVVSGMGGAGMGWDYVRARDAIEARGGKVISIDCRRNESISAFPDSWIPIVPGTDGALCAALIHEFIDMGKIDEGFLSSYTVGWDDSTMPSANKSRNLSYKDYILGKGYDRIPKTPEWASVITKIPVKTITNLAWEIANAKAPFIVQGGGVQRHYNGEETARMIAMIPLVLGKVGLAGTNPGVPIGCEQTYFVDSFDALIENPLKVSISAYQLLEAIDHGNTMTSSNAGVTGAERLRSNIKFIWNYASNSLTNQLGSISAAHEILQDESKCEFIVASDVTMTDSVKYADIVLPDAMRLEQFSMQTQGRRDSYKGLFYGEPMQAPPMECKSSYDVCLMLADKLGKREEFSANRTPEQWYEYLYEEGRKRDGDLPFWSDFLNMHFYVKETPSSVGFEAFRSKPNENKLATSSGKIEIYSDDIAHLNSSWYLDPLDKIYPIPEYHSPLHGMEEISKEYPYYCLSFSPLGQAHSFLSSSSNMREMFPGYMWINNEDAKREGLVTNDLVKVQSKEGVLLIKAFVTNRIIPGTLAIPTGNNHQADMYGDKVDHGGCVNSLSSYHPTPLAKGNGVNNALVVRISRG